MSDTFTQKHTRSSSQLGFTIIEVIVSIGILLFIGGGVIAFQRSVIMNAKTLQSALLAQSQVRKTLLMFASDLRSASSRDGGGYPIESAGTSTIIFYANIDSDVAIERVRYFIGTSTSATKYTLRRGVVNPTGTSYSGTEVITTIARDVMNSSSTPVFTYFDGNYDGITASSTAPLPLPINIPVVRLVRISLLLNPNGVRSPAMQTYGTAVTIRNLKDNL